ncbi:MAG: tetratricopeptide repeat protein [Desulfovibrio sp.]|nr:tetratricopeptide repeat protein [Desulfovibrio sp.]
MHQNQSNDMQAETKTPRIHGVFSSQEVRKVGTGTTTRKSVHKTFWFVDQKEDAIVCQPLNTNYVPSGPKRTISMEDLLTKFAPEPEFYQSSVFPKMQKLNDTINKGDDHLQKGEHFSAEHQYSAALKVDSDNVRANFGIGLTYLERGDTSKAQNIFDRLVKLDSAFETEHKHLFNEFGIQLRKNKMIPQAIAYYERAIALTQSDENLYMNVARAYLEGNNIPKCIDNLLMALGIAPHHVPSLKFLAWLIQRNLVPQDRLPAVNQVIARSQEEEPAAVDESDVVSTPPPSQAVPQQAVQSLPRVEPEAMSLPQLLENANK